MTQRTLPLLLSDQLVPITTEIGFLEADSTRVAEAFISWQLGFDWAARAGLAHEIRQVHGDLGRLLPQLLPLREILCDRYLFIPTASQWTAFFDNGQRGPDVGSPITVLAHRLACRGLRVVADPAELDSHPRHPVSHGAIILDVYDPDIEPELWPPARGLAAVRDYDDKTWIWREVGTPLPFERPTPANSRAEHFGLALLNEYLEALGVRAFDEAWYAPNGEAILVVERRHGPNPPIANYLTLEDAQQRTLRPDRATRAIGY